LFSLLVIGVVVSVVAGAGTFSAFTDTATADPEQVTAGDIELSIDGSETEPFAMTLVGTICNPSELAPPSGSFTGDVCAEQIAITNTGDLSFTYTITAWVDEDNTDTGNDGPTGDNVETCFNLHIIGPATSAPAEQTYATVVAANTSSVSDAPTTNEYPTPDDTDLNDGEGAMHWRLSVAVDDLDVCQEETGFIMIRIVATQSATPHD
jgi:predicted ribosomally synthesized peptide with SipW-like signal peptide